jgi:hypothetical protein
MFAVRQMEIHGKHISLSCVGNVFAVRLVPTHGKDNEQGNGGNVRWEKNVCHAPRNKRTTNYLFAVRQYKNIRQTIFYQSFFAVRPKKCARKCAWQRSERTANIDFPVVKRELYLYRLCIQSLIYSVFL